MTNPEVPIVQKAFAYITVGRKLVVFEEPDYPDVGIQVPAGTVEPGEPLEDAVMREAFEETGLRDLRFGRYLGQTLFDLRPWGRHEIHEREYFHLIGESIPGKSWIHLEQHAHGMVESSIRFRLFLVDFMDADPDLTAGHDALIPELRRTFGGFGT